MFIHIEALVQVTAKANQQRGEPHNRSKFHLRLSVIVPLSGAKTRVIFRDRGTPAAAASITIKLLLPHSEKSGTKSRDT